MNGGRSTVRGRSIGEPRARTLADLRLGPGRLFGDFRLKRRLGDGASAQVWLAVPEPPTRDAAVALKIFRPEQRSPEEVASMRDEARIGALLDHPGVVGVQGLEVHLGVPFLVMEAVEGITLEDLIRRGVARGLGLPAAAIVDLGIQLAEGLAHAHEVLGPDGEPLLLVHRDLKPANILVTPQGITKITDFGLAKTRVTARTTETGLLRGTPSYVAPEVWAGTRDFQASVDLYALGAILWEVCVGRTLHGGSLAVVIGAALNGSAEEDAAGIPQRMAPLRPVVCSLLERDPHRRLRSASEAAASLRAAMPELDTAGALRSFLALVEASEREAEAWAVDSADRAEFLVDPAWWAALEQVATGSEEDLFAPEAELAGIRSPEWQADPEEEADTDSSLRLDFGLDDTPSASAGPSLFADDSLWTPAGVSAAQTLPPGPNPTSVSDTPGPTSAAAPEPGTSHAETPPIPAPASGPAPPRAPAAGAPAPLPSAPPSTEAAAPGDSGPAPVAPGTPRWVAPALVASAVFGFVVSELLRAL